MWRAGMTGANSSSTSQCSMKCDSRHQRLPSTACRSLRGAGPRHLHTHTRQSTPGRRRDRQSLRGRFEPTLDSQTVAATRSPTGEGSGALLPRYPGQGKARQGKKLPLRHQAHGTRYTSIAPRLCTADGVRLQMEDSSTTAPRLRRAATWAPVRAMMPPMHRIAQAVTIPSAASPWCVCVCVCVCVCAPSSRLPQIAARPSCPTKLRVRAVAHKPDFVERPLWVSPKRPRGHGRSLCFGKTTTGWCRSAIEAPPPQAGPTCDDAATLRVCLSVPNVLSCPPSPQAASGSCATGARQEARVPPLPRMSARVDIHVRRSP